MVSLVWRKLRDGEWKGTARMRLALARKVTGVEIFVWPVFNRTTLCYFAVKGTGAKR